MEKSILLVEDNVDHAEITSKELEEKGYRVEVVENGSNCLKKARRKPI